MKAKVPQDVQREDTIIGPITLKQLIILGVGGGSAYATYIVLARSYGIEIWLAPVALISGTTLAFAFLKIHNLPFHLFLMNFIEYHFLARKRIWRQGADDLVIQKEEEKKEEVQIVKVKKNQKTIEELTKILDTKN